MILQFYSRTFIPNKNVAKYVNKFLDKNWLTFITSDKYSNLKQNFPSSVKSSKNAKK